MTGHEVFVNADVPFFYDFMLTDEVPSDPKQKQNFISLIDRKISAAKDFLNYVDTLDRKNSQVQPLNIPQQYKTVQKDISKSIVDGNYFIKLNQDYNHTTFEIDDTKSNKQRMEGELTTCARVSEEAKAKFHEAVAELGKKAGALDTSTLGKLTIIDPAILMHLNKVCYWILDVYYDTPASKYEWENFKKQIFVSDKGDDLRRRIQGLYIPKLYDYQIETCRYILSTRPMFMKELNDRNFDLILSTADDIIKAFTARLDYTNSKKVISENKLKIFQSGTARNLFTL